MEKLTQFGKNLLPVIVLILLLKPTNLTAQNNLASEKQTLLKVVTAIHFTFRQYADEIWPGYDLSRQPYIAYMPDDFVLLLNSNHAPQGFQPYPEDWPDIGARAFVYFGVYRNLVGQFVFNFKIDSITTFAMGLPKNLLFSFDDPEYMLLSSTIHEGFHQFQQEHFGEISWAREELYPILNVQNTALASLEMHVLRAALRAMFQNNLQKMEERLKEFVAVREYRWKHTDRFVQKYEQGQEINEGTARYVEMKAMDCFFKLDTTRCQNELFTEIKKDLADKSIQKLLIGDMEARLSGLAVTPENMLRNRIYPVGAALGFLLDRLGLPWKTKFQAAGHQVSFSGMLKSYFRLNSISLEEWLKKTKADFNYSRIKTSAEKLIGQYFKEYQQALNKFNAQKGIRIEINLSGNGLQRFRSTREKKWVVEKGKKLLCLYYNLYSLKSNKNGLLLEARDKAIFEQNDWETRKKKVIFYGAHVNNLTVDNVNVDIGKKQKMTFASIRLIGEHFKFHAEQRGKIVVKKNAITLFLF
ncbi:hypothetical protein ACX8XP_11640 [Calditrichota bacterium LG25]